MAYIALLALAALDGAGYSVIAPIVPTIGDRTGAGPAPIGVLVACFALGQLAAYPLAGRAIRQLHSSWVLGVSLVLVAVGDLGFVLAESLTVFFPARVVQGVGAGGLWMGFVFGVLERFPGDEYRRLTGILGAYSIGSIGGSGIAAVGGIRGPFLLHLALVLGAALAVAALGAPQARPAFGSDRAALRTPGFRLSAAAVLLLSIGVGTLDGPLPLHFGERLSQGEIATLFVGVSLGVAASAAAAGWMSPRTALVLGSAALTGGLALAGAVSSVGVWIVAGALVAIGLGTGEAGALGVLLETTGTQRIVLAMVVWSQIWGVGYLAGPSLAGVLVEVVGFAAVGLLPLTAAALVMAALLAPAGARVGLR